MANFQYQNPVFVLLVLWFKEGWWFEDGDSTGEMFSLLRYFIFYSKCLRSVNVIYTSILTQPAKKKALISP